MNIPSPVFKWQNLLNHLRQHRGLVTVAAIYVILTVAYSVIVPLNAGPDEVDHFRFIEYLVKEHHLPTDASQATKAGKKSLQPPFYHGLIALVTAWVDTSNPPVLKALSYSPREQLVTNYIYTRKFLQTADMEMPYKGKVLLWHLSRFISIILGLGVVIVTYLLTLELFPTERYLAFLAAATVAFLPRFVFISSVVNDDIMIAFLIALYLWLLVKVVKGAHKPGIFIGIGLLLGLSFATKYQVILIPLLFSLVLARVAKVHQQQWRYWAKQLLVTGVVTMVFGGWFFVYVAWYFNEIETLGPVLGIIEPIAPFITTNARPAQLLQASLSQNGPAIVATREPFLPWLTVFFQSFWAEPLPTGYPLSPYPFIIMFLWLGVILIGLWQVWRRKQRFQRVWLVILLLHVFAFVPLVLLGYFVGGSIGETAQGRHVVLPAISAVGILLAWGWTAFIDSPRSKWLVSLLPLFLLSWSAAYLFFLQAFYPPLLPVYTNPEVVDRIENPVGKKLVDGVELVGYNLDLQSEQLVLDLIWRSLQVANDDYLVELNVLDEFGQLQTQWIGHQGNGLYPTRAWKPNEIVKDTIHLPLTGLSVGNYQLQIQLVRAYRWPPETVSNPLPLTNVALKAESNLSGGHRLKIPYENTEITLAYKLWQPNWFNRLQSTYRYRATIPLVWQMETPHSAELQVQLSLVGPDQQTWLPKTAMGQLSTFIVEAGWAPGAYRLQGEVRKKGEIMGVAESEPILSVENIQRQFVEPPITHRLDANFADQVVLLGYHLPSRRVEAGDSLPVTVYWKPLQTMGQSLIMFNNLLDAKQREWGGYDRQPQDVGNTILWIPGEIITDGYVVPVDPIAPDGVYYLRAGLYLAAGETVFNLPLMQNGQPTEITSVVIGPIKVGGPPPNLVVNNSHPQHNVSVDLGDVIRLLGYDFVIVESSNKAQLSLYWQNLARVEKDYTTFVHLLDRQSQIVAQKDAPPVAGAYPTSLWDPGEVIVDTITFPFPDTASVEEYTLKVGLYDPATGARLTIPNSSDNGILLTLN